MTITAHKLITQVDGHGILSALGPYANAAARRAATVTAAQVSQGSVALQTDTGEIWFLASQSAGVPTWVKINTTADSIGFSGNFGALVPGVSQYMRGDLGLHTTSTIVNTWDNQAGAASNMTEKTATVGIGSTGAGIGGRASVVQNGSSQAGSFTLALAAPGTTPTFYYLVSKQVRTSLPGAPQRIISDASGNAFLLYQDAASDTLRQYGDTGFQDVAAPITHVWARTAVLFVGGTGDLIKWGNRAIVTGTKTQNASGGGARYLGFDSSSGAYNQAEFGLILTGQGVNAGNFAATLAALDAATDSWFGAGNILI